MSIVTHACRANYTNKHSIKLFLPKYVSHQAWKSQSDPSDWDSPWSEKEKQHSFTFLQPLKTKKRLRVCLVEDTRVTHHDICYAVKEGRYSQAKNHLLYSGN